MRRVLPAFVIVHALATLLCFLARPEPSSLLAPVAGPWAGHLYGHVCCTMATVMPVASWLTLAVLPLVLIVAALNRRHVGFALPLFAWWLAWTGLAWMSVVNSTS